MACSSTTRAAYSACLFDSLDSYWISIGKCRNERDAADRIECNKDARAGLAEGYGQCFSQRTARADLCDELGQSPYDPSFEPGNFVDPREVGKTVAPNPYFPLTSGKTYVYKGADEVVRVTFTDEIKIIDDVPCLVVRDVVSTLDGDLVEDTIDWYAQDVHGNVWYCGEITAEYEDGFPVNVDGSFQADVDGARPGIQMKAAPAVGDVYRQEFDLGNAEDVAKVLSLHASATSPAASCDQTCLATDEFTPISPGVHETKYYKPGVGFILQTKPGSDERLELIEIVND